MSVTGILLYLSLPLALWGAFAVSWFMKTQGDVLVYVSMLLASFFLITGPFWIFYVVYLIKKLVPRLDQLSGEAPSAEDSNHGNWLTRSTRLNNYAANLLSARARRRSNLPIEMEQQPPAVRLALRVHVYWMCSIVLALLVDFVLMEIIR
ncbi:hypothetical protein [Marinobacter sp. LN3S78]|uniref:hypothetical protein n=1 Tax=Marinobacter sp. LN3S78 TaxID=3382300 RepID=UPI00387B5EBF